MERAVPALHRLCRRSPYATDDAFLGDDVLFRYGAELAMGLALLRGRFLDADVHQIAVWDGLSAPGAAGTAIDIATWSGRGHTTTVLTPDDPASSTRARSAILGERRIREARRPRAAVRGHQSFSKLVDAQLPRFTRHVLGAVADVLARHDDHVCYRNTWGDGLYVVLTGAEEAAACALELQDAVAGIDLAARGLPDHLALRLGSHLGPVFPVHDPVLGRDSFMGSHVSRTARIEPVTPPGAVFVTEPFAAAHELAGSSLACDYVGHLPAAKQFGRLRMYRLRRPAAKRDSTCKSS